MGGSYDTGYNPQAAADPASTPAAKQQALLEQMQQQITDLSADPNVIKASSDAKIQAMQAQLANDQARGYDENGKPIAAAFQTTQNADGTMQDAYKMKDWQNVNANTDALSKMRDQALRDPGTLSQYGQSELNRLGMQKTQNLDEYAKSAAAKQAQAQSMMAQAGGMSAGGRANLAKASMLASLTGQQGVRRQANMDEATLRSQDEQSRMSMLNQVQGLENGNANLQFQNQQQQGNREQGNINNALQNVTQQRQYDANAYNQRMSAWAANKSADAQAKAANSGGGGKK